MLFAELHLWVRDMSGDWEGGGAEWRELYQERAGIMEFEGHMSRERAEKLAELDVRKLCERQK